MTAFHLHRAAPAFDERCFARPRTDRKWAFEQAGLLGRALGACAARVREHVRRRRVMAELFRLSDHELADIGLSRSEIGFNYSPEVAERRNAERRG